MIYGIGISIYLILIAILYFVIFRKHHKRNNVTLDELVTLVSDFYANTIMVTLIIILGFYSIISAIDVQDDRTDVIVHVTLGIIINVCAIWYYIGYIKNHLKDYNQDVRTKARKAAFKFAEIIQVVVFAIFAFAPILLIPYFLSIFDDKFLLYKSVGVSFMIMISSIFLLYVLNPIDIRNKVKTFFEK